MVYALDRANEDGVVAGFVCLLNHALDHRQCAIKDRSAILASVMGDAVELVFAFSRESLRNLALLFSQHIHRERLRLADDRVRISPMIDAYQDFRRIERQRAEGIRCQAARLAIPIYNRDDGHSGGEAPQRAAKIERI